MICQYQFPKFTCQVSSAAISTLLCCLFHLLVIHNHFLDVEIIALCSRPSPRKRQETNIKLWWKELAIKAAKRHHLSNVQIKNRGRSEVSDYLCSSLIGGRWVTVLNGRKVSWGGKGKGREGPTCDLLIYGNTVRRAVSDKLSLKWNYLLDGTGGEFVRLCIYFGCNQFGRKKEINPRIQARQISQLLL